MEKVDAVGADQVNDAVLLSDAPRPGVGCQVAQGLGFADATERVAKDRLDQIEYTKSDSPIGFDPVAEIFKKLGLEDGSALSPLFR